MTHQSKDGGGMSCLRWHSSSPSCRTAFHSHKVAPTWEPMVQLYLGTDYGWFSWKTILRSQRDLWSIKIDQESVGKWVCAACVTSLPLRCQINKPPRKPCLIEKSNNKWLTIVRWSHTAEIAPRRSRGRWGDLHEIWNDGKTVIVARL